jgi:leader peptidase (prepilin peptidase)/N-methyltransferase
MNVGAFSLTDTPAWFAFFTVLAFTWGGCIGSFLNVCIYRIPRDVSVVKPRSHCPHCNQLIPWYYNIPLLSYVQLRGRCAFCKARITPRYVLVELLTAVLFVLVWQKFDTGHAARPLGLVPINNLALVPVYWLMVSGLILGTFVDFEHMILPDRVTLGGIVAGLLLSALAPAMQGQDSMLHGFLHSLLGAAVGWGSLWAVAAMGSLIFRKEAMGFGDVKLLGAIGAFLGWKAILFSIMLSSFAGSLVGIAFVLTKKKEMGSRIPYGPYLALAAVVWILWGQAWWHAYTGLMCRY